MDQLKPYTLRKLIVDVICAMIRDNYLDDRPEDFYSFLLGGKEPLYTFLDLCKSTKTLLLESDSMTAYFDKEVCLTEEDVILHCGPKGFKHFLIKNLLKHTRRLICDQYFLTDSAFSIVPFLADMQNLEELVLNYPANLEDTRTLFHNLKSVKSIESELLTFKLMDSVVENYKLEKMIIKLPYRPRGYPDYRTTFTNLFPVELHLCGFPVHYVLEFVKDLKTSSSIAGAKKIVFSPAYRKIGHFNEFARSISEVIELIETKFPLLEELEIKNTLGFTDNLSENVNMEYMNMSEFKEASNDCEEKLENYEGKLKLKFSWKNRRAYVRSGDLPRFLARMHRTFPTYNYSVENADNNPTHHWKTVSVFSTNAILDVDISFFEV